MRISKTFKKLIKHYYSNKEILILQGGARSGKTHSILQLLYIIASNPKNKLIISIVAGTLPQLKRGALRQFIEILGDKYNEDTHNKTDNIFTFGSSIIEFFSADNSGKVRGAERDVLFVNEVNVGVSKQIFEQLEMRTKLKTIVDYNPETNFYITNDIAKQDNSVLFISTYKDNKFLPQKIIDGIERLETTNPEAWRVFGLGLIGQYEGLVFKNTRVEELNINDYGQLYYGLDFGYFPDPFAFIISAKVGNTIFVLKEICVNGLENSEIAELIKPYCNNNPVFCDSAEPKSIKELKTYGIRGAKGVKKGADSKRYRINWLKGFEIVIDKSCTNLMKELESYSRMKDKNGEILPLFQDGNDHLIDALTYAYNPVMCQISKTVGSKSSLY